MIVVYFDYKHVRLKIKTKKNSSLNPFSNSALFVNGRIILLLFIKNTVGSPIHNFMTITIILGGNSNKHVSIFTIIKGNI